MLSRSSLIHQIKPFNKFRFFSLKLNQILQQDEVDSPLKKPGSTNARPAGDALKYGNVHTFSDTNDKPNPPENKADPKISFFHVDGKEKTRDQVKAQQVNEFPFEKEHLSVNPFEEERKLIHEIEEGADEGVIEGKTKGEKQTLGQHLEQKGYHPKDSPWAE